MPNYLPNSNKYKQQQKEAAERERATKVVSGEVTTKKKSAGHKLRDLFISEDAGTVKSYLLTDVIIPAAKKLMTDIVKDGIDILLYGGANRSRDSRGNTTIPFVNYSRASTNNRDTRESVRTAGWNFDEIAFGSRSDAEIVREQMDAMIDRYGYTTVADMYDMAGRTAPMSGNNYGWRSVANVGISRTRDGYYLLDLPKPMPVD